MKHHFGPFKGVAPKIHPDYLPEGMAVQAENCKFFRGSLHPWNQPLEVATPGKAGAKSIFLYENEFWLSWVQENVKVARSPIANDTYKRLYWTGEGSPKMSTFGKITTGGTVYPMASYPLGIPAPATTPTVTINADWTQATLPVGGVFWSGLAYGNGVFVGVASNPSHGGTALTITSTDGETWTLHETALPESSNWAISFANGLFVALSTGLGTSGAVSADGINWTAITLPTSDYWGPVAYGRGVYVAIAMGEYWPNGSVATAYSSDGTTWVAATMPARALWRSVTYGNGTFVAIAAGNIAATSYDGITWIQRMLPSNCENVTFGNGKFVAVGFGMDVVCTSSDGIAWNVSNLPTGAGATYTRVVFGDGVFMATGALTTGTTHCIASADGVTWSKKPLVAIDDAWGPISYGNNTFVVLSNQSAIAATIPRPNFDLTKVETWVYIQRYVSQFGEEGPPNSTPVSVDVSPAQKPHLAGLGPAVYDPAKTYSVGDVVERAGAVYINKTAITVPEAWASTHWDLTAINKVEIYRKVSGDYQYVDAISIGTTTYDDEIASAALGKVIDSTLYAMPPLDLASIQPLSSGCLVGYSATDKAVYFTPPYKPHAWAYSVPFAEKIMGIGAFGTSVLVVTDGVPYVITGQDPAALSKERLERGHACTNSAGIVDMGGDLVYPSTMGLGVVAVNGVGSATENLLSQDDWKEWYAATTKAFFYAGCYLAFDALKSFMLNPKSGDLAPLNMAVPDGGFYDPATGYLYLLLGGKIVQWDAGNTSMSLTWKSGPKTSSRPHCMNWGKVLADTYPVTVSVISDGAVVHTQVATNNKPFRITQHARGLRDQVAVTGTGEVSHVIIAEGIEELAV